MTPGHLSIHDVAPHTLKEVERMIDALQGWGVPRTMLLVIPGLPWTQGELDALREMVSQGHLLAGHGWVHEVSHPKTLFHRMHSALLSRNVAEHLSLSEDQIAALMQENYDWFIGQGFEAPTHYVPPAWALGGISRERLRTLPFATVEVLRGVIETSSGVFHRMPLLGYEADTAFRAWFLRQFNQWNIVSARRSGRCIRLSLHPYDLDLRLKEAIGPDCRRFAYSPKVRLEADDAHAA